ncbi:MAG: hypothetical protein GY739_09555, partial [Mesoflavibacter sp.]|nr:hypothetical protein [Mesoflavibacter sp.]
MEPFIFMAKQSRVMLRTNLSTGSGLVNGAMGTVHDVIYKPDTAPPALPLYVLVKFDDYSGPSFCEDVENVVPICPIKGEIPLCLAW